ncbi:HEPN domain-containing protein [Patescibacteria group bacterium]|nr:HEPN domain-containing protein [Patescibacteria group bacterium]MBU1703229.1 HEPN domain-containing protein [Patescibacteria group bacterium]MBU1953843.1 HEPN domain-containing protein [Patescibacteria group bacterium]
MLKKDIKKKSQEMLRDAEILFDNKRYDGAVYICGYALELGLKNCICKRLNWSEYPISQKYKSFRTHDFDVLLNLTGKGGKIKTQFFAEWAVSLTWKPENRYYKARIIKKGDAQLMITSVKKLLKKI